MLEALDVKRWQASGEAEIQALTEQHGLGEKVIAQHARTWMT